MTVIILTSNFDYSERLQHFIYTLCNASSLNDEPRQSEILSLDVSILLHVGSCSDVWSIIHQSGFLRYQKDRPV